MDALTDQVTLDGCQNVAGSAGFAPVCQRQAVPGSAFLGRPDGWRLPVAPLPVHADRMFSVTETEAASIRRVFEEEGELSAMIELRRHFPGITDNAKARECARTIAGWKPALAASRPVTPLHPGKRRSAG